ncbi:hypothetical protein chiPu_0021971, partial [Chiloscyllium punctatum]|nr:hypothetical protein [Chiloscyllium punctatum]
EVTSSSRDEDCFEEVANLLEEKDKEVSEIIKDIYSRQRGNRSQEDLLRGLHSILCPVISTLFVGKPIERGDCLINLMLYILYDMLAV